MRPSNSTGGTCAAVGVTPALTAKRVATIPTLKDSKIVLDDGRWTIERVLRIITTLVGIGMVVFFFYNYIRISNMFGDFGITFGSESAPTVITDLVGESHDVSLDGYLTV